MVDNDDDAVDCSSGSAAALDFSTQESCTTSTVLRYDALWAQATYANRDFNFTHTMSFVEWTIKINGITTATTCDITLSATGMQNKAELDFAEGKLSGTNAGNITLKGVNIDANGEAVVYVALFPGQVTSQITAVVTMPDGKMTTGQLGFFESGSYTFVANTLYTAAWTFGAPVEPTYTFTVTSPDAIEYNETTTGNYTVKSSATIGGTTKPVPWTVTKYEYSDDGGITWEDETPSWFSSLSLTGGEGSIEGENGTATVIAAELVDQNPVNSILKNATEKSDYDLSDGKETANCYVISAPGTYKIPLIYGNARNADGLANTVCFNNTSPFVNYKGTAITNMWLKTDGTPSTGSLVWSDCGDDIVSDLAVSGDFLTFRVSADAIKQGNAVVAVKDSDGVIMWSWHLWFTDSGALSTIAFDNADGETQHFTRDHLGFAYDTYRGTSYVTPRRMRVTVTQAGSNQIAQFQIIQNPGTLSVSFHDTKYQFGRKDAFSGSSVGDPTYTAGKTTYQNAIQTPGVFYTVPYQTADWCSTTSTGVFVYNYAWSVSEVNGDVPTSAITKSVYDPCPAGFKMPGSTAFTGFSTNNAGTFALGYTFTDYSNSTSVFFPATGIRFYSTGRMDNLNYAGNCWTAVSDRSAFAFDMGYGTAAIYRVSSGPRAYGMSVRPVKIEN